MSVAQIELVLKQRERVLAEDALRLFSTIQAANGPIFAGGDDAKSGADRFLSRMKQMASGGLPETEKSSTIEQERAAFRAMLEAANKDALKARKQHG